ncbi:MAG: methylated-DNA--[protein]-cysteine S-methyltransferase, partial [Blastocatellia bacterium]
MNWVCYTHWESPVGKLLLAADERGLRQVHFLPARTALPLSDWVKDRSPLEEAIRQLDAYFRGELREFTLPLSLVGTEFQLQVWRKLCEIPYGEVTSYGELARQLGNSKGARAVGLANGSNPI